MGRNVIYGEPVARMSAPARNPGRPITAARPIPDFASLIRATTMRPSMFANVIYGVGRHL
jgi:hypothetical protein